MNRYARPVRRQGDPIATAMVIRLQAARDDARFQAGLLQIRQDLAALLDTCPTDPEAFPAWMLGQGGWSKVIDTLAERALGDGAVPGAFGTTLLLRHAFNYSDNQDIRLFGCRYYQEHRMGATA